MKQGANIYTMMLILSFLAILIACLFLFLELQDYDMNINVPPNLKAPSAMVSPGLDIGVSPALLA